jgi:hypothetical protein
MPKNGIMKHLSLLVALLVLCGCYGEQLPLENRHSLVEVDGMHLYKDEVELLLATNPQADSAQFVNEYIERWATEQLFYSKAADNVASMPEIENMIESYRRSLILNIYQSKLVEQHLKSAISQDDVVAFYNANKVLFDADESMFKGLLLVLPAKAPNLNKVRKWCVDMNPEDMEEIETYSAENALVYEYLMDRWYPLSDVVKHTPLTEFQLMERLSRKKTIEFKEDGKVYFVCSDTILREGDTLPVELVSAEINELLLNSRRADFIKRKKKDLFEEAKAKGIIKYNNQQTVTDNITEK